MSFKITARTILQLGAELISSDAVALYELIKNAIDAKSKTGVDVKFEVVIRQSDFASAMAMLDQGESGAITLEDLQAALLAKIIPDAAPELRHRFERAVMEARTLQRLVSQASAAYQECNRIIVTDTGHGMSEDDLREVYLTLGTTNRADAVKAAVKSGVGTAPYLGEKGLGRLAVMRLGSKVVIETATVKDSTTNTLEIDWREFEEAYDKPASSVVLEPRPGNKKALGESFTTITISGLRASWSSKSIEQMAREQIARLADPFSWAQKRRFQIRLSFNEQIISPVRSIATDFLNNAHGKCSGRFELKNGSPVLTAKFDSTLYGGAPSEHAFDLMDLISMSGLRDSGQPTAVLRTLGPFEFEFYWFNRQRLRAIPNIGDRQAVRELVRTWAGVCLFRDGYRVMPYGDEGDDWLGLDREAFAAAGYKLNTKQIIGRVRIGRVTNPRLLDQTNRQGLSDCPEKAVLVHLLRRLIATWWHDYLNEASRSQKIKDSLSYDALKESAGVNSLEERAARSIQQIRPHYTGDAQLLREVKDAFLEIKDAHRRAVERINAIEEEKDRLTQLAGIGLMIEVIAHELTRATELTQATLKDLGRQGIGPEASSSLKVLGTQIRVIQNRLRTLEPLSIPARQRRSHIKLSSIIDFVLEAHKAQFERHSIEWNLSEKSDRDLTGFVVEGHVVQILENLINNSVYWLDLQRKEHPSFRPRIVFEILAAPPRIRVFDNGPGIPKNRIESVFEPFFSTKSGSTLRRQGLGLYIARENAELLGGTLSLVDLGTQHEGRYNTFELEVRENKE